MILLDSNIVIYAMNPELPKVAGFLEERRCFASEVTRLEVMGYHRLTDAEYSMFKIFFANIELLQISSDVIDQATLARQIQYRHRRRHHCSNGTDTPIGRRD